jgi:hypothetical protein
MKWRLQHPYSIEMHGCHDITEKVDTFHQRIGQPGAIDKRTLSFQRELRRDNADGEGARAFVASAG